MPYIIVTTSQPPATVLHKERVTPADLQSAHFRAQLLQRLAWAVGDASELQQAGQPAPRAADRTPGSPSSATASDLLARPARA
jgi:hypothetical protein